MFEAAQCAPDGSIPIQQLPPELRPALKTFDMDGDGTIDPMELARGAELYAQSKDTVKKLTRLALALLLLMGIMLAAITGLTFTVVELSKETTTSSDGVQTVKGSTESVKTASADTLSVGGVTVDRTTGKPASVAPVLTPTPLTSLLPTASFHEMRYFKVSSPLGAELQLFVHGTARMPREGSIHGTVIEIVTQVGHIILDDELLYIEHEDASHMFMRAGFPVSNSTSTSGGRALLGIFELMGFFNAIDGLKPEGASEDMVLPKLNKDLLYAEIKVYVPCDAAEYPTLMAETSDYAGADLCESGGEDFPGMELYDANLDGVMTRHIAYTEKSWTKDGQTLAIKYYENAPSLEVKEFRDIDANIQYKWVERFGQIYACSLEDLGLPQEPESMESVDPELAASVTALSDTSNLVGDPQVYADLGMDVSDLELPDYSDENTTVTPDEDGVKNEVVDETTATVGTRYTFEGAASVRGFSARRFKVNTTLKGKWEAWDMYEYTDEDGFSRPVRFAYVDKANNGVQYNEILEWTYGGFDADAVLVVPSVFDGLKDGDKPDKFQCPNNTSPKLPALDGPFGAMWDVMDNVTLVLQQTAEENAQDYADGLQSGNTTIGNAFEDALTEGRRELMERVEAGIYSLDEIEEMDFEHQLAGHLESMSRRFERALSEDADPNHPDVVSIRRYLAERASERKLEAAAGGRELEQTIYDNNIPFDVYMWPPCGPEFTPWIDPSVCVDSYEAASKRALQIQFKMKFFLQIPWWWTSGIDIKRPDTWPIVFDGFAVGGEVPLDPWRTGIVTAYGEAGWENARDLFDDKWWTNGWGTIYGEMGVKAGIKDLIPNAVQVILPSSFIDLFEQNLVSLRVQFDSTTPYIDLIGKMCLFIAGFYSCLPLIGFQVFLELKMDVVGMVRTGALKATLSDFGLEYYHPGLCQGWFPVWWWAVRWCRSCWRVCCCWGRCWGGCFPYPCGGYWYIAFWAPYWYPCRKSGTLSAKSFLGLPSWWLTLLNVGSLFSGKKMLA